MWGRFPFEHSLPFHYEMSGRLSATSNDARTFIEISLNPIFILKPHNHSECSMLAHLRDLRSASIPFHILKLRIVLHFFTQHGSCCFGLLFRPHRLAGCHSGQLTAAVADFTIGGRHGPLDLVTSNVSARACRSGSLLFVPDRLRKHLGQVLIMIYVTAIVAVFLFGYLVAAMVRPEWF
jgi:K+-transporting ATPase KdpF subunit